MNQKIFSHIEQFVKSGKKMLVRLIDPDKFDASTLCSGFDFYFVGGSTATDCTAVVRAIHAACSTPVILFPGSPTQFTPEADALLFLTLMNSRDPRFLIDMHLRSADAIAASGIESIPMGYILIDGGRESTTQRITSTQALNPDNPDDIVRYARTAELLGKRLIYLEAGSGANTPVPQQVILSVKQAVSIPVIVGGGICSPDQMCDAFVAGADLVVIGNHFEHHPEQIPLFLTSLKKSSD